jgi:hypothetical protein
VVPCSLADGSNGLWETDNIVGSNNYLCREGPPDPCCSRSEVEARRWQVEQLQPGRSNTKSLVVEGPAKSKGSRKGAVGAPERNAMCWAAATATPPTVADTQQGQQVAPNILGAAGTTWPPLAPDNDQQHGTPPQGLHIM